MSFHSMDEEQPLLYDEEINKPETLTFRQRVGELLESRRFHIILLILISIDAACVLADLSYSFLDESCSPSEEEPVWLTVLSNISLAITSVFLIEIPLAMWAFGPSFYNPFSETIHATLHLIDALVIIGTFIIEVALKGRERELASLLVLVRLWRLVKLIGGVAVGVGETGEESAKELARLRILYRQKEEELHQSQMEAQQLRQRLLAFEG